MFLLLVVILDRPCSDVGCKTTGYPLHSPLSPSLPLPCVTVCHQIPNELYHPTPQFACNVSACNVSVNNFPDTSYNDNVNALSVVVPNGCIDFNELILPKFNNIAKQAVTHFLRELDEYFALKKTPNELKFLLCFRANEDPFARVCDSLWHCWDTQKLWQRSRTFYGDKWTKPKKVV